MIFGYTAKHQSLITSLLFGVLVISFLIFQACKTDKPRLDDQAVIFHPDSLPIVSASQKPESLSATRIKDGILLTYSGSHDQVVKVRIYDDDNRLVYGERELILKIGNSTRINFESISFDHYQLFVFFDNNEFLVAEVKDPPK